MINSMRDEITQNNGPASVTFTRISGGPPLTKPISVKIRGDNFDSLTKVSNELSKFLKTVDSVFDISDDNTPGRNELNLRLNQESIKQSGLDPNNIARAIRLLIDGEIVAYVRTGENKLTFELNQIY